MRKELLKFQIDQLRKDKMIYALESIALTFIIELSYVLIVYLLNKPVSVKLTVVALIIPLLYYLYCAVGNTIRLIKIKRLEQELYK